MVFSPAKKKINTQMVKKIERSAAEAERPNNYEKYSTFSAKCKQQGKKSLIAKKGG
jgi:hypothetical protein